MASPQIAFRAQPPLDQQLDDRAGPHGGPADVARRDLGRYYSLLANELRGVDLSVAEACLICDVVRGTIQDDIGIGSQAGLAMEIQDGIRLEYLDDKWDVEGALLVSKAVAWTFGQRWAICDAAERWWAHDWPDDTDYGAQMRAVGLVG